MISEYLKETELIITTVKLILYCFEFVLDKSLLIQFQINMFCHYVIRLQGSVTGGKTSQSKAELMKNDAILYLKALQEDVERTICYIRITQL